MGFKSDFEDILDNTCKEHAIGISTHKHEAYDVHSFKKSTNVSAIAWIRIV